MILAVRLHVFIAGSFLKKNRVLNIQDGCFQFLFEKKDKKFVDFFHDLRKHQLLNPPQVPHPETPTFMWPDRPSSCFLFTIFSSVFFSGTTSGTSRRSSMAPAIIRISAVNAKLHRQTSGLKSCCWSFLSCFQSLVSQQKTELKVSSKVADLI